MSRRSLAARIGAQTTTGGVVVVADPHQYRLLEDKHRRAGSPPGPAGLGRRPYPPRSTGHPNRTVRMYHRVEVCRAPGTRARLPRTGTLTHTAHGARLTATRIGTARLIMSVRACVAGLCFARVNTGGAASRRCSAHVFGRRWRTGPDHRDGAAPASVAAPAA